MKYENDQVNTDPLTPPVSTSSFIPHPSSFSSDDTIAAIACGAGGAARGMVRVSGPQVVDCLAACFTPSDSTDLRAIRRAMVVSGKATLAGFTSPLPCDLHLWPDARSYTRQPAAELHTFGSPPLLEALVATLCAAGARPARSGEFTLRAFLAGRLDVTQAEAVLGVIDAHDDRELRAALNQLAGGLGQPLRTLRNELLDLLAHLEAGLDFVDEDIEFISKAELDWQLALKSIFVGSVAAQMVSRAESILAPRVVLIGRPNVGKSSLFNALVGKSGAIVSPIAGTTRDYLSSRVDFGGIACELVDTAGVEADSGVHGMRAAAQEATAEQHDRAHVRVLCLDATQRWNDWERDEATRIDRIPTLVVWTKVDAAQFVPSTPVGIHTSVFTNRGIEAVRAAIGGLVSGALIQDGSIVASTAVRCRESLRLAAECLTRARNELAAAGGDEIVAAEIRLALDALGDVVGAVYTDDILDRIFGRFCIGK